MSDTVIIRKPSSFLDPSLLKEFSGKHMREFELGACFGKNPKQEPYKFSWTNDPNIKVFVWTDENPNICTFRMDCDPFQYALGFRDDFDYIDYCKKILPNKYGQYIIPQSADLLVGIKTPEYIPYSLRNQYCNPPLNMGIFQTIPKMPIPIGIPGLCPLEVVFSGQESKLPIIIRFRQLNTNLYKKYVDERIYFYNREFERFAVCQGQYIREYDE